MKPICVVDTNVVVSGLVSRAEGAPPQLVLDAMLQACMAFALSIELLAEYREVLLRPRIGGLHGLDFQEVDEVLRRLALEAVEVAPEASGLAGGADPELPPITPLPHGVEPADIHVARLVLASPGRTLITGDAALSSALRSVCRVLSAAEAVAVLGLSSDRL